MIKKNLQNFLQYIKTLAKWLVLAALVGAVGGVIGSGFHECVDYVTELRGNFPWLIFLLPVGGLAIAGLYLLFRNKGAIDTNRVLRAARGEENVPLIMAPLIFISTVITHLLGGSAGREGAALQLGGSIGYNFGKLFRLNKKELRMIVMAGMSSVFAALFGTPITAAFFALEVVNVGSMPYAAFVPCVFSSAVAYAIAQKFGITPVRFSTVVFESFSVGVLARVLLLALLCALVSILFCRAIHFCEHYAEKLLPNKFLRAAAGGAVLILLTLLVRTQAYNGAGMNVITAAMGGTADWEASLLKIVFTAITIAAGFKGGEIVPTFFIGATFGCVFGSLLGLEASFGAAIGFTSLFCAVVNCPLASVMLAAEVFGGEGLLLFAAACAVSYMMSGYSGLYKSQQILYSKLDTEAREA